MDFRWTHKREAASVAAVILLIGGLLRWGSIWWWSGDDPALLKLSINSRYWEHFLSPSTYRELTASNLTPWAFTLYKLDWDLFGFRPAAFHLHQFFSISIALFLLQRLCRRWFGLTASMVAVLAFMLSKPMIEAGETLMQRHYVEGLAFSLGAVLCFLRSLRSSGGAWSGASAVLYFLACSAKEIYVPLPIVLLILPAGAWRPRLKSAVAPFAVLAVYILWRHWMLGNLGGYGVKVDVARILQTPISLLDLLGWHGAVQVGFLLGLGVAALVLAPKEAKLLVLALPALAVLPVVPVMAYKAVRYAFPLSLILALLFAWSTERTRTWGRGGRILAVLIAALGIGHAVWSDVVQWRPHLRRHLAKARCEGQYVFFGENPMDYIKDPIQPPWFFHSLGWIRVQVEGRPPGPKALYDPVILLNRENYRVLTYHWASGSLVLVKDFDRQMDRFKASIRGDAPLSFKLIYEEPLIRWDFGPWKEGRYTVIFEGDYQVIHPLIRKGFHPLKIAEPWTLRLKYSSPEGWVTYSPIFHFQEEQGRAELIWARP